jgi:RNA polymerase sigma-70 factor (ECF subfamily)
VAADSDSRAEIVAAQTGDAAAFEQLVRAVDKDVRAFSHRVLGPAWSEDVVQEAYLRAFRGLSRFRPEQGSFRSWLYRIVYRCCLDELRRRRRRLLPWDSALEELVSANSAEPQASMRDDLWRALGALSSEERACVVLVDGLGFDYESAATILDVPRGTVASRLSRARPLLREAVREPQAETEGEGHVRTPR